jgi:hypothetical protein
MRQQTVNGRMLLADAVAPTTAINMGGFDFHFRATLRVNTLRSKKKSQLWEDCLVQSSKDVRPCQPEANSRLVVQVKSVIGTCPASAYQALTAGCNVFELCILRA